MFSKKKAWPVPCAWIGCGGPGTHGNKIRLCIHHLAELERELDTIRSEAAREANPFIRAFGGGGAQTFGKLKSFLIEDQSGGRELRVRVMSDAEWLVNLVYERESGVARSWESKAGSLSDAIASVLGGAKVSNVDLVG